MSLLNTAKEAILWAPKKIDQFAFGGNISKLLGDVLTTGKHLIDGALHTPKRIFDAISESGKPTPKAA